MATKALLASIILTLVTLAACAPAAPAPTPTSPPPAKPTAAPAAPVAPAATAAPKAPAATPAPAAAKPGALDALVEGARKEGVVRMVFPGDIGERGARRLNEAFNKKYNLNIRLEPTLSTSFAIEVGKATTEIKTGASVSWDVMNGTARHFADWVPAGYLITYDWPGTFSHIARDGMLYNGAFVINGGEYYQPLYNPNLVKPADVPKKWEDLLDARWKENIVTHNSAAGWVRLTEFWGEERVTAFVEGFAKQKPLFVSGLQVPQRLISGEYPLAATAFVSSIFVEQAKGAPLRYAEEVKPIIAEQYGLVILQKAQNPNAAKLFAAFNVTPEGLQIWWEETKRGMPTVPGPLADWLKGKEVRYTSVDFLVKEGPRLEDKYLKILGLR
ncbi:MAG: extracellular solute-binding protein [Chloroflexi bacterium]|nr:extracellular solute-binding protein [Chloroflexota bacterium]